MSKLIRTLARAAFMAQCVPQFACRCQQQCGLLLTTAGLLTMFGSLDNGETQMAKIEQAADAAKVEQDAAVRQAPSALASYWAGSISASVDRHIRRGAVHKLEAK